MSDNFPADNSVNLANTVKEMTARLTTVEGHLDAQTKMNDKLQAENKEFKAGKAKQDKELFEVRGTCTEFKKNKVQNDHSQLKGHYAYEVTSLPHFPCPPLEMRILTCWERCTGILNHLRNQG